ncbi:MAG: O-antigen ligase family protein [Candidatus Omnitrophica bacterium]|nr:O-antigen ligase family protein [Candidatus Omnitrophota bacterium]MBU2251629.1 O-antigen ligase family protein [Candidatus Omnitrophota bacterium]
MIFYIAISLSMFVSGPLLKKSFHAWFFKWGEGFLLFYFAQVFLNKKQIKWLIGLFLLSSLLINIDGLHQVIKGVSFIRNYPMLFHNDLLAPTATFRHYNDFASYLVVSFFLLFGFLLSTRQLSYRLILVLFLPLLLTNLFLTYSRGAWLSLMILIIFVFLFATTKRIKIVSLVFILGLLTALVSIPVIQERFLSIFKYGGDADRFRVWKAAFLMFNSSPLIGKGIGTFMDYLKQYGSQYFIVQYAHNCYLQILAETGMIGFLAFFWFLGELFSRGYRSIKANKNYLSMGIFCALSAFLIHSFFDTQLYSLRLSIMFWLLLSFLTIYVKE